MLVVVFPESGFGVEVVMEKDTLGRMNAALMDKATLRRMKVAWKRMKKASGSYTWRFDDPPPATRNERARLWWNLRAMQLNLALTRKWVDGQDVEKALQRLES